MEAVGQSVTLELMMDNVAGSVMNLAQQFCLSIMSLRLKRRSRQPSSNALRLPSGQKRDFPIME
jgi:hypothetical protein